MVAVKSNRNAEILSRVLGGETYAVIAADHALTVARIGQLVDREARRNADYRRELEAVRQAKS